MSETQPFDPLRMIEDHARKCGLTPRKLLLAAAMDPSTLSHWRRGLFVPSGLTLKRLLAVEPQRGAE